LGDLRHRKKQSQEQSSENMPWAGLYRVQLSVFLGDMNPNRIDELSIKINDLINENKDRVYIFPMCKDDFSKVKLLGQAFDKKLVTDELKSLFV